MHGYARTVSPVRLREQLPAASPASPPPFPPLSHPQQPQQGRQHAASCGASAGGSQGWRTAPHPQAEAIRSLEAQVATLNAAIEQRPADKAITVHCPEQVHGLAELRAELAREGGTDAQLQGPNAPHCRAIRASIHRHVAGQLAEWADLWEQRGSAHAAQAADGVRAACDAQLASALAAAEERARSRADAAAREIQELKAEAVRQAGYQKDLWRHVTEASAAAEEGVKGLAAEVAAQLGGVRAEVERLRRRVDGGAAGEEARVVRLEEAVVDVRGALEGLEAGAEAAAEAAVRRAAALEKPLRALRKRVDGHEGRLGRLEEEAAEAAAGGADGPSEDAAAAAAAAAAAQKRFAQRYEKLLAESQAEVAELKEALAACESRVTNVEDDLQTRAKSAQIKKEMLSHTEVLKKELDALRVRVTANEEAIEEQGKATLALDDKVESTRASVAKQLAQAMTEMQELASNCEDQLHHVTRETASWRDRVAEAEVAVGQLRGFTEKLAEGRDDTVTELGVRLTELEESHHAMTRRALRELELANKELSAAS